MHLFRDRMGTHSGPVRGARRRQRRISSAAHSLARAGVSICMFAASLAGSAYPSCRCRGFSMRPVRGPAPNRLVRCSRGLTPLSRNVTFRNRAIAVHRDHAHGDEFEPFPVLAIANGIVVERADFTLGVLRIALQQFGASTHPRSAPRRGTQTRWGSLPGAYCAKRCCVRNCSGVPGFDAPLAEKEKQTRRERNRTECETCLHWCTPEAVGALERNSAPAATAWRIAAAVALVCSGALLRRPR